MRRRSRPPTALTPPRQHHGCGHPHKSGKNLGTAQIEALEPRDDGWLPFRPNMLIVPRGYRTEMGGHSFVWLGGAASVDRKPRLIADRCSPVASWRTCRRAREMRGFGLVRHGPVDVGHRVSSSKAIPAERISAVRVAK